MNVLLHPDRHRAVIFDLDGVLTDTASLHRMAWGELFDAYLGGPGGEGAEMRRPFGDDDYRQFIDGRARHDGVDAFLRSRGIALAWGTPGDAAGLHTVCGLGNRKNELFLERLRSSGAVAFADALPLLRRLRGGGIAVAVISASRNAAEVLRGAGLEAEFAVRVDGVVAAALGLAGKPDPAVFLEAARRLGVAPHQAAVVEDAQAGVRAAKQGGFGLVIGIDRGGDAELGPHGADVVVHGLDAITVAPPEPRRPL